jgi:3-deoxy-D-manno-octulosonic-acid transferase
MSAAEQRRLPVLLVDAVAPFVRRWWLWPGLIKGAVKAFHAILTVDELTARSYRKLGAPTVQRLGRMENESIALPYFESERAELATVFATRPIWLACDVPQTEEAAVIAAHRTAMRLAHRLLLILVPRDSARASALAERLELDEGGLVARRELNEEPAPEIAVYIAETPDEYGLWYRLAPVTFMGGSLLGQGSSRSPMEAAALGSAIIHGRRTGDFGSEYGRLGAALGAVVASNPTELADLLSELLAPDRAARLAHAAWGVASEGAEVTARIVTIIMQSLGDAR